MRDKVEQKKFYYPSGKLWSERYYKQGVPHGRHREWHENGVLASEVYLKDGVPDGIGRQWDENGDLIVEYEIKNGTGIQKVWIGNQGIWAETSWVNGTRTGRLRAYLEDGTVMGDTFWIRNEKVSKKRYMEACKTDQSLPRYLEQCDSQEKTKKPPRPINASK
ncbi:MAG: toxin-antitoxin system YwqK family antitoxin, partial [Planctomycetota bacterium]